MLSALIALLGALVYGSADFLGGLAARRLRSIVVTAVSAASGLVVLVVGLPLFGVDATGADMAWGVAAGLFGIVAVVLLYACLAIGPMSILSPLTAVVSAIAPMLWGLLVKGESLSPLGYAGLAVALVAVVLVGFIPGAKVVRPSARGLVMAVGAGIAIGAFLIVIDQTRDQSGLVPLVFSRLTSVVITGAVVGFMILAAVRRGRTVTAVLTPADPDLGATPDGARRSRARDSAHPHADPRVHPRPRLVARHRMRRPRRRRERLHAARAEARGSVGRLSAHGALPGRDDPARGDRASRAHRRCAMDRARARAGRGGDARGRLTRCDVSAREVGQPRAKSSAHEETSAMIPSAVSARAIHIVNRTPGAVRVSRTRSRDPRRA